MATPIPMPKQGNSVVECLIVDWKIKEGDTVKSGDVVCTIETDKASFDVESPADGTILKLFRAAGDLVPVLTNIAAVGNPGEDVSALAPDGVAVTEHAKNISEKESAQHVKATNTAQSANVSTLSSEDGSTLVSPRAKKLANKLGIDPKELAGSGAKGRVSQNDILAAADSGSRMTPTAAEEARAAGKIGITPTGIGGRIRSADLVDKTAKVQSQQADSAKIIPFRGIRKLIGGRMHESLKETAQLTLNASADVTSILEYRAKVKAHGESFGLPNISVGDCILYVVAKTLAKYPEINSIFDAKNEQIIQYNTVNLAVAVDTPRGLMVPVIFGADQLSLSEISAKVREYADACRKGSIDPDLLQGGTFTVSNLGALGIESFTPVLNYPQAAILGVCSVIERPMQSENGGIKFVPMMGLSLTIDHQVIDGAPGARFLQALSKNLTNFELLLSV